ncbi:CPBP family intramembrane glutamic endopeptidase [Dysgonomonas sp. 511]|uniref:CPBP family intramembrane glutamic endopeptidase n=1 Tax=Dysgonomonas sp. 511 TaxID=2302930 RepID=UPI001C884691|nr:type II CAAX endopeptidase family protein [Dysgonomonas sp. 511]NDV79355.1 CPBP family intramembrane metalloprotease [Dysgonomonas sp. 511]
MTMKHLEFALNGDKRIKLFVVSVIVLVLSFVIASLVGSIPIALVAKALANGQSVDAYLSDMASSGLSQNMLFALMVLPLVFAFFVLLFLIKAFHKWSFTQIVNGTNKIRWNHVWVGAGVWAALSIISLAVEYMLHPADFTLQFDISTFIPLVLLSLILLPFQTSFEELAFRGYLAQTVGNLTRNRWWVLIIPSLVFGLLHISNPEVAEFGIALMLPQYIIMGAIMGLTSILDDGIEVALGIHAANNIFASLFITHSSSALQTPALFSVADIDPVGSLISTVLFGVVSIAVFHKLYGWKFSVMNRRIEEVADTGSCQAQ